MENVKAEMAVLGAALMSSEAYAQVVSSLTETDFTKLEHQTIFSAIKKLHNDGIPLDPIILADALGHQVAKVGGMQYITNLFLSLPSAANVSHHIDIVREVSRKRHLVIDLERIIADIRSGNPTVNYLQKIDTALQTYRRPTKDNVEKIGSIAHDVYTDIINGKSLGSPTGFTVLDQTLGGLKNGEVYVIAGRPAMGKTTLASNIAANFARNGSTTIYFSLEQPATDMAKRSLISASECSEHEIRSQSFGARDQVNSIIYEMKNWPLYICDKTYTLSDITEQCYAVKLKAKTLQLIVIDYLQLIKSSQRKNTTRENEVSELSRQIKLMARNLDCPILLLSQLSRAPEQRVNHMPILADLRESGAIEQDADAVIFVYRPWVYDNSKDLGDAYIIIAKNRNGETGKIPVAWDGEHFKFMDKK